MLGIPTAIWLGLLTILSLFVTFSLGIAMIKFRKDVLRYHMRMAFITITLAVIHLVFAVALWFFGVAI